MHEMPMVRDLIRIVLAECEPRHVKSVKSVSLTIGELNDAVEAFVGEYFRYFARGTVAEGAEVVVTRSPATLRCLACGEIFPADEAAEAAELPEVGDGARAHRAARTCPRCGTAGRYTLFSGTEMTVDSIEVEVSDPEVSDA